MPEVISATGNPTPQVEFGGRSAPVEPQPTAQGDQRAEQSRAQQEALEVRRAERAAEAESNGRVDTFA